MSDSRENTASNERYYNQYNPGQNILPMHRMGPENRNHATFDDQITEELDMNSRALLSWCATVFPIVITLMIALVTSTVWITGTIHDTARENRLELKQDLQTTRQEIRQDLQTMHLEFRQDLQLNRQEIMHRMDRMEDKAENARKEAK